MTTTHVHTMALIGLFCSSTFLFFSTAVRSGWTGVPSQELRWGLFSGTAGMTYWISILTVITTPLWDGASTVLMNLLITVILAAIAIPFAAIFFGIASPGGVGLIGRGPFNHARTDGEPIQ